MIDAFLQSGTLMSTGSGKLLVGSGKKIKLANPQKEGVSFYFPDFFLEDDEPWHTHENVKEISIEDLLKHLGESKSEKFQWKTASKQFFEETFKEIKHLINSKNLSKAVPFVFDSCYGKMESERLRSSIISLLNYAKNNAIYVYGFWDSTEGMLGATPEMLFVWDSKQKNLVKTVACAGTKKNDLSNSDSLLKDPKELREHCFVIEGIISSLNKFGNVMVGDPKLVHLKHLTHIFTEIALELNQEFDFEAIVQSLHPTPALGAFPRNAGLQWLRNFQNKLDRKRFGAPVGYFKSGQEVRTYVAIRNIQWRNDQLLLGAGCGIVDGSLCEKEWNEIRLKMDSIKEILSI